MSYIQPRYSLCSASLRVQLDGIAANELENQYRDEIKNLEREFDDVSMHLENIRR